MTSYQTEKNGTGRKHCRTFDVNNTKLQNNNKDRDINL
jgi:hypothetical protein